MYSNYCAINCRPTSDNEWNLNRCRACLESREFDRDKNGCQGLQGLCFKKGGKQPGFIPETAHLDVFSRKIMATN
jgi:hypothetical protein